MRLGKIEKEIVVVMAGANLIVPDGAVRIGRNTFDWYGSIRDIIGGRLGYLYKKNKAWHLKSSFNPAYSRVVRNLIKKDLMTWVKIVYQGFEVTDSKQYSGAISLTQKGKARARGINISRAKKMSIEKLKS